MMIYQKLSEIDIDGQRVEYLKLGHGKNNLLMIHGLTITKLSGAIERSARFASNFCDNYTVYFVDRFPNLKRGTTTRDLAAQNVKFMDALNIDKATVIGYSQGGMIAQWMAIDNPERVERLVLSVTMTRPTPTIPIVKIWSNLARVGKLKDLFEFSQHLCYSEKWLYAHRKDPIDVPDKKDLRDWEQYDILVDACLTHDTSASLHRIACPVLAIGGKKDYVVSFQGTQDILDILHCDKIIYDDMGHGLYDEDPHFSEKVIEWIKKVS